MSNLESPKPSQKTQILHKEGPDSANVHPPLILLTSKHAKRPKQASFGHLALEVLLHLRKPILFLYTLECVILLYCTILYTYLFISISISIYLYIYISIYLYIYISIYLYIYISIYLYIYLSIYLSIYLYIYMCVCYMSLPWRPQ